MAPSASWLTVTAPAPAGCEPFAPEGDMLADCSFLLPFAFYHQQPQHHQQHHHQQPQHHQQQQQQQQLYPYQLLEQQLPAAAAVPAVAVAALQESDAFMRSLAHAALHGGDPTSRAHVAEMCRQQRSVMTAFESLGIPHDTLMEWMTL